MDRDIGTFGSQAKRDGPAKALTSAGNKRNAIFQSAAHDLRTYHNSRRC